MLILDKAKAAIRSFHGWLNAIGSILLAYALANPGAFSELRDLLPEDVRPYAPMAALLWFALVQAAKIRAVKAAQ